MGQFSVDVSMPPEESSEPLYEVVQDYWNEKEQTWTERTKPEIRRALYHIIDFVWKDRQIQIKTGGYFLK